MSKCETSSSRIIPLRPLAAIALWSLTGIFAVILAGRAAAGAFDEPVHGVIPSFATVIGLASSLIAWQLHANIAVSSNPKRRLLTGLLSLVPPAMIGFSTSFHASPISLGVTTGFLLIGLVVVVVCEAMQVDIDQFSKMQPAGFVTSSVATSDVDAGETQLVQEEPHTTFGEVLEGLAPDVEQSNLRQRITRSRDADGSEMIEATLAATFDVGAKEVAIHLPIHPVLLSTPHVECEPLDDSEVTVAVTTVQPYGIRIEVKRSEGLDESLTVPVGVAVTASCQVADVA